MEEKTWRILFSFFLPTTKKTSKGDDDEGNTIVVT